MNILEKKIKERFPNENIEVLSYTIMKEPASVKCLNCGTIYGLKAENFIRKGKKCICKKCVPNKVEQARKTKEKFLEYLKQSSFELITDISEDSFSVTTPVACRCKRCKQISEKTIHDYMRGRGCKHCANNQLLAQIEYQDWLGEEYTALGEYKGKNKSLLLRHNLCGFCYKKNARYYHCPKCSGSQGEQKISFLLDNAKTPYVKEKEEIISGHKLRFDFFLPSYDAYIEYQGKQHTEAIPYFGGEEGLMKQQLYDKYKVDWAAENKKKLLIIKYDEDIKTKIFNFLLKFNDHLERE